VTVPIPTIHLSNLGTGPEGITVTELTKQVLSEIEKAAVEGGGKLSGRHRKSR